MIVGYFHIALMADDAGMLIAADMHSHIMSSGLYDASDIINLVFLGDDGKAQSLYNTLFIHHPKYVVRKCSLNLMEWEWATLEIIQRDSYAGEEGTQLWYAHTKGSSQFVDGVPAQIQKNVDTWRRHMCYHMFERHKEAQRALVQYAAVGPLYISGPERYKDVPSVKEPIPRHFSGNFWWTTYSYIGSLPGIDQPLKRSRVESEMWIGRGTGILGALSVCAHSVDLYDLAGVYGEAGPLSPSHCVSDTF